MNIKIQKYDFFKVGTYFFNLGIFLLPSAFFFSSIFLILSLIISNFKNKNLLKDSWNIPLIICSFLMVIVCFFSNINPQNFYNLSIDKSLNWLGLTNWIPMFWLYWCAQYYLKDNKGRRSCAIFLILGTIPILISGFGQYYFEWYGPFKILNGTIIWYQRESTDGVQIFTGPFNNPNIAGTWLASIFPFCFFYILKNLKIKTYKIFYIFLTLATLLAAFLTHSRNAIINISIPLLFLLGISFKFIFFILAVIFILSASIFIFEIPLDFLSLFKENNILSGFIPRTNKISDLLNFPRIKILGTAISNIIKNPFLGWGASSFSTLYLIKNGNEYGLKTYQHTHNLVIEIAHNYGVIVSFILFTTIFLLVYKSKPVIFSKESSEDLINKFWWIATFTIIMMHMTDIAYYDGRISILFWILMAGTRCILREINFKKEKLNTINT